MRGLQRSIPSTDRPACEMIHGVFTFALVEFHRRRTADSARPSSLTAHRFVEEVPLGMARSRTHPGRTRSRHPVDRRSSARPGVPRGRCRDPDDAVSGRRRRARDEGQLRPLRRHAVTRTRRPRPCSGVPDRLDGPAVRRRVRRRRRPDDREGARRSASTSRVPATATASDRSGSRSSATAGRHHRSLPLDIRVTPQRGRRGQPDHRLPAAQGPVDEHVHVQPDAPQRHGRGPDVHRRRPPARPAGPSPPRSAPRARPPARSSRPGARRRSR